MVKPGDRGRALHPVDGIVEVVFVERDVDWQDPPGVIPDLLVGVYERDGQVLVIPSEATPKIKAWREEIIQKRHLVEARQFQAMLDDQRVKLTAQLKDWERLGLLDEDGCLDEDKLAIYEAQQAEAARPETFNERFGEFRALLSVPFEARQWSKISALMTELNQMDDGRHLEMVCRYFWDVMEGRRAS